jgi:hypothetical protein
MTRLCTAFVFIFLLGGCATRATERPVGDAGIATLIVSRTATVCSQCKLAPDAALIELREPSGKLVWSSIPGQEPDRLALRAGRWEVTYFCPGIADFEGHQEIVVESGASYIVSCGDLPNYPLQLRRASGAPNQSFEADGYAAAQFQR